MADAPVIHIGENSPEHVAYRLMQDIALVEKRALHASDVSSGWRSADRKWIIDTYIECIKATRGYPQKA